MDLKRVGTFSPRTFSDPRTKLMRAKTFLSELRTEVHNYLLMNDLIRMSVEYNYKAQTRYIRLQYLIEVPETIGLVVGDIVHNLRCSLDWATWAIVQPTEHKAKLAVQFPSGSSESAFKNSVRGRIPSQNTELTERFDSLRVYPGANDDLYAITCLDNTDKHRLILPTRLKYHMNTSLRCIDNCNDDMISPVYFEGIYHQRLIEWATNSFSWPEIVVEQNAINCFRHFSILDLCFPLSWDESSLPSIAGNPVISTMERLVDAAEKAIDYLQ
jgi:hypothetical protein